MSIIFSWNDRFRRQIAGAALATIFLVAVLPGCSVNKAVEKTSRTIQKTSRKIAREVAFSGNDFKRVVALGSYQNGASVREAEFQALMTDQLPDFLFNDCGDGLIRAAEIPEHAGLFKEPPRLASGQVDAYALAIIGRQFGINAVIFSSVENLRLIEELHGILFKDKVHFVQLVVRVEIYQSLTASKIMDTIYRREVPIDEDEYAEYSRNQQSLPGQSPQIREAFIDMIGEIGEDICEAIPEEPWSGFVTAVDGDRVVISAGTLVGLEAGTELSVLDSTRTLQGADGQRYFLPGADVARIRIVELTDVRAEAVRIDGEPIKVGSSVRRK